MKGKKGELNPWLLLTAVLLAVKVISGDSSRLSCGKPCLLRGKGINPGVCFSASLQSSVPQHHGALEISGSWDACGKPLVANDSCKN